MGRSVPVIVSIDTEEDNWRPSRDGVTVDNIRELPRLHALLRRLGVRVTYFTTYQVAIRDWAVATLRELHAGGAEIGAHLHPWNTPPLDEPFLPRNSMLSNLPAGLQLAKLECLTDTLRRGLGVEPAVFRAGRYALGPETVTALIRCGYQVDSSVTPFVSWEAFDEGPSFHGAPQDPYRLEGGSDVRVPHPGGALLEIPMSVGFNRAPFAVWSRIRGMLASPVLRRLHLAGLASRVGLVKRIFLSPEMHDVSDMLALSRHLIDGGAAYLHLFFHSGSLRPGLSPYSPDGAAVERLYARIAGYVEQLARLASPTFVTVGEAATRLGTAPLRAAAPAERAVTR